MKTVEIVGKRQAVLAECPEPKATGNFVVVKNLIIPMCTEYKYYRAGENHHPFGHEIAGEVVEVAQPGRLHVGDLVVGLPRPSCGVCELCLAGDYIYCKNKPDVAGITGSTSGLDTYSQYIIMQDRIAIKVPPGMSLEHASMAACGLGPTFGAMEVMGVSPFDTVLLTGLGPVGLGGVINAVTRGARVIGVESNPYRAELAKALGAEIVINPLDPDALSQILSLTEGRGAEKGIDCSGSPDAQRLLVDAARPKGQVGFIGEAGNFTLQVSKDLLRKGLTLHGLWHYNLNLAPRMLSTIARNASRIDMQITHRFPMSQAAEAFELQITGFCGKVLLDPWA